jgi:hypothetical protein
MADGVFFNPEKTRTPDIIDHLGLRVVDGVFKKT